MRTGITLGKEYNINDPQKHSNVYAKINWLHDFYGELGTNLMDTYGDTAVFTHSLGGNSWNAGIGFTVNLNNSAHLYAEYEKNFGGDVNFWVAQVGCRWTF